MLHHRCVDNIPFDSESSNPRLFRKHVSLHALNDGFGRRLGIELFGVVLVVDIVSNAHELSTIVTAREEDDGNT